MVTIIDARRIRDIAGGGAFQGGGIFFTLAFPIGSTETFQCDLALLPRLVGHLRQFAMIAARPGMSPKRRTSPRPSRSRAC